MQKFKTVFLVFTMFFGSTLMSISAEAAATYTCKVQVPGIESFIARGNSAEDAFTIAATKCFDLFKQKNHIAPDEQMPEEAGLDAIDTCAQIHCG